MRISDWSSDVCSSDLQELTPDINLYASYNRGTHSGGFSIGGPGTPPYKPEVLDAYEVGLKSRLFDGVLELNMAGFYYDYSNMQIGRSHVCTPVTNVHLVCRLLLENKTIHNNHTNTHQTKNP